MGTVQKKTLSMKEVAFAIGIAFSLSLSIARNLNDQPGNHRGKYLYQPTCGTPTPIRQKRMTKDADIRPYGKQPWLVNIYIHMHDTLVDDNYIQRWCGGTIISEDWILTAAHCVTYSTPFDDSFGIRYSYSFSTGDHSVRLSNNETTGPIITIPDHLNNSKPSEIIKYLYETDEYEQVHEPEIIIPHEQYKMVSNRTHFKSSNDIALIKLKSKIILDSHNMPACLPKIDDSKITADSCETMGWGYDEKYFTENKKEPEYAKISAVPILDVRTCLAELSSIYSKYDSIYHTEYEHELLLCSSSKTGSTTCNGDSGGPLMCKERDGNNILRGITSWGEPFCMDKTFYTNVAAYGNWIHEKTKIPLVTERNNIETAVYEQ